MDRWNGRVALAAGASAGIGEGIARELARLGLKVAACARSLDKLQELQKDVQNKGFPGKIIPIQCDLRKVDDILKMFEVINRDLGGVDICINNAGICHTSSLLDGTVDQWKEMLDVNILAVSICTKESVKSMKEHKVDDGQIIHISSMSGHRLTVDDEHFYAVTKQGVRVMTEALRAELRHIGSHIRIASISPANVKTDMLTRLKDVTPEAGVGAAADAAVAKDASAPDPYAAALDVSDIVDAVVYILSAKPHAQVHDVLIRAVEQIL